MNLSNSRAVSIAAVLFLGSLAAAAFAGPGPQYWNHPAPAPVQPSAKQACNGCKTTVARTFTDRGPAGKTVAGTKAESKHECSKCTGAIVSAKGAVKDTMTMNQMTCAGMACCR